MVSPPCIDKRRLQKNKVTDMRSALSGKVPLRFPREHHSIRCRVLKELQINMAVQSND